MSRSQYYLEIGKYSKATKDAKMMSKFDEKFDELMESIVLDKFASKDDISAYDYIKADDEARAKLLKGKSKVQLYKLEGELRKKEPKLALKVRIAYRNTK